MEYKHIQIGYVTIASLSAGILFVLSLIVFHGPSWVLLSILFILVISLVLFSSLTIEVGNGVLKSSFGPGLISKTVRLADVEICEIIRNPWYYGWGIHWTPHG